VQNTSNIIYDILFALLVTKKIIFFKHIFYSVPRVGGNRIWNTCPVDAVMAIIYSSLRWSPALLQRFNELVKR